MTKIEFLSASLPYGLKVRVLCGDGVFDTIDTLTIGNLYELGVNRITPIVRPLSDLIKPIEHKGEKFVPSEWFELGDDDNHCFDFGNNNTGIVRELEPIAKYGLVSDINYLPFAVVQKLIEWHFDIADLLSKGEAINVNTLEENPYK